MSRKIRVAILDDHQSVVDGYLYRLGNQAQIEVVATLTYGEELEVTMAKSRADVLLLDVNVPTSPDNPNPYPILHEIPTLLQKYPDLNILVISMYTERGLIRAVSEAGVSGYILKDDQAIIRDLPNVILSVADGGICFSQKAHHLLLSQEATPSHQHLSVRQMEVLSICASHPDFSTTDLAKKLMVSNSTIRNLLSTAYMRLGVHTRAAAIAKARQLGILTADFPSPH